MGRKVRFFFKDVAQHIQICGIDNHNVFRDNKDYLFYIDLLGDLSCVLNVDIHAYSLNDTSINLLCTFEDKDKQSRFMQSLGLRYVSYFNKKYKRRGTLWQGRYKSSFVEDKYILQVMHYIESQQNSIYSTKDKSALARNIIREHEVYKLLGSNQEDRENIYIRKFQAEPLKKSIIDFIKDNLKRQTITGSLEFYKKLESIAGETLGKKRRGRPKKIKQKGKKMFTKLVVLDKEKHKSLKVSPLENLNFAKNLAFIPILVGETVAVSEMFPVVFTADETPSLVTLTSLGGENLAINEAGKYISRYVPAFLRKYPFSLASTKENPEKKVILIDEEAGNISKTKGKQLFTKSGEQSEVLKNAISFLSDYEQQSQNTVAIAKAIQDAGILEDREISIGEGEEKKVLVNGFKVVNREKLNALDDATLALWVRQGIINFIDAHIKSLERMDTLFKIASQNQQS